MADELRSYIEEELGAVGAVVDLRDTLLIDQDSRPFMHSGNSGETYVSVYHNKNGTTIHITQAYCERSLQREESFWGKRLFKFGGEGKNIDEIVEAYRGKGVILKRDNE